MSAPLRIRKPDMPAEVGVLTGIWRRGAEATHDFLTAADIVHLERAVAEDYLPHDDGIWVAVDDNDIPLGFIGLDGSNVDALWVDPAAHGTGIGIALLEFALESHDELTVDVNEQNPLAHAFYHRRGFVDVGRSPTDDEGRPFPIVHMRLAGSRFVGRSSPPAG